MIEWWKHEEMIRCSPTHQQQRMLMGSIVTTVNIPKSLHVT